MSNGIEALVAQLRTVKAGEVLALCGVPAAHEDDPVERNWLRRRPISRISGYSAV